MESKFKVFFKEFITALFNVEFYDGFTLIEILFNSSVMLVILVLIFLQLGGI